MAQAVDWLERRAALSPERVALVDALSGERRSYRAWNRAVNRTAHWLHEALGLETGQRLAVLSSNSFAYLDLWFACNKTGAILQNLNWRLATEELAALIGDAGPTVLCYSQEFADAVRTLEANGGCRSVQHWVAMDAPPLRTSHRSLAERDASPDEVFPMPELDADHPWVICYTGGTTGLPKGAILTHGNISWNAINTVMSWGVGAEDTAILNAPLFHTGALNVFTAPLIQAGGCSVVCRGFDPDQVFDLLAGGGVSLFFGVPTMFTVLQNHERWEQADFSALKLVISGGAPCPLPVFHRFWERGVDFKTGYGLTEAGPNTFWLPPEQVREKPGAVGYPLFHVQTRLLGLDGKDVSAPGVAGELLIRGPHRTPGYWNNPGATSEAIDPDGWLHTGDLAERDADGAYTIVGRLKDMYISGGENVYPAEIESVVHAHPDVAEAAVFGVPDPTWGEVGCAAVVLRGGARPDADSLRRWLKQRLAAYKVPRRIEFVDSLPTTGAGKLDKRALQRRYGG
ncbi:MAG: long-chain fatty acid--CoA ligase [Ectothiorhodospiraceae bacterium]|nr:long-chain fatty acid--CoA ligase [Ectothiorhodospiraceae bacterium]MCH8506389.1 long-chain fatty acid--CoA ligase [Ectothiorhodospiraceae bacterium]